jgi:iron complex outermembrane receptor protein
MRFGNVDFTSITAYRSHEYFSRTDTDRSPVDMAYDGDPEDVDTLSEEVRFAWSTGSFDWLVGAYYFDRNSSNFSFIELGPDLADLFGAPEIAGLRVGSDAEIGTTSLSGFASATWRASDQLDFTSADATRTRRRTSTTSRQTHLGCSADRSASRRTIRGRSSRRMGRHGTGSRPT